MGVFKHRRYWWMEYKRITPKIRIVKSTGFLVDDPEGHRKALAAFGALKVAMGIKPKRSAMEGILEAIYGDQAKAAAGIPLVSVWDIYEDWRKGKGRVVAHDTWVNQHNLVERFVAWAAERKAFDMSDVSVAIARDYIISLGKANKTLRTYCGYLSQMWEAVGQLHPGVHNPWKAACPDNDGSSVRHEDFTEKQIADILKEAKRIGHDWYLASMIALHTGLRYGDIATMVWGDAKAAEKVKRLDNGVIDTKAGILVCDPNKTKKSSGVRVWLPIAKPVLKLLRQGDTDEFVLPEHGVKYPQPLKVPFSDVLRAVGIEGKEYGFHSYRHTANSIMADAGIPSETRQLIFGWTNDEMARHYDHAKHLKELTEAINTISIKQK